MTEIDFVSMMSDLNAKLLSTKERVTELAQQRRPHAFGAATGDSAAIKALKDIDARLATARNEAETLTIAIEETERRKAEYRAQLAAQDRQRRETEARAICKSILKVDQEFDRLAAQVQAKLTERQELIQKLAALDVVYSGMIHALQRKRQINGALMFAGIHQFAELNLVGPDARRSLAESDKSLNKPIMTDPAVDGSAVNRESNEERAAECAQS
jgi:hypothetical protein